METGDLGENKLHGFPLELSTICEGIIFALKPYALHPCG